MKPDLISVVMPYWERPLSTTRGLRSMMDQYLGCEDIEFILVDDGSREAPALSELGHFIEAFHVARMNLRIVALPKKDGAMNPCVPINAGVAAAAGEYVVLTNPETVHERSILYDMRGECRRGGRDAYVLAAVWAPEAQAWHCHSEKARAGYHFCTMLHRDLWDKVGGFDEEYRDGYCFDDPDFVQRLVRAGAKFIFRDDLVALHHQGLDAKHFQPRHLWDRNHDLFRRKWPNPIDHQGQAISAARIQNQE